MSDDNEWIEYCRYYNLNPTNMTDYNAYKIECKNVGIPLKMPENKIPIKPLQKTPPQILEETLREKVDPKKCNQLIYDSKNPDKYNNSKHLYDLYDCKNKLNQEFPLLLQEKTKNIDTSIEEQLKKLKGLSEGLTTGDILIIGLLALSISIILHLSIQQYIEDKINEESEKNNTTIKAFMITFILFLILGSLITWFSSESPILKNIGLSLLVVSLLEFYKLFTSLFTKFIASGNKGKIAGFWIFGLVLLILNFSFIGLRESLKDYYNIIGGVEWTIIILISFALASALFANKPL